MCIALSYLGCRRESSVLFKLYDIVCYDVRFPTTMRAKILVFERNMYVASQIDAYRIFSRRTPLGVKELYVCILDSD